MPNISLKNQILGYYYINATKNNKRVYVYFRFSDSESYILNFVFPKNKISYVFFYKNPDDNNNLWVSTKAGDNLHLAMDQPNISLREKIQLVIIADPEKKSINFITKDTHDNLFSAKLFDQNDKVTVYENIMETTIRDSIINGNAGTRLTGWFVDGDTNFSFVDSEISKLIELSTKLHSYMNNHSIGVALRNIPRTFYAPFISSMTTEIVPKSEPTSIRVPV